MQQIDIFDSLVEVGMVLAALIGGFVAFLFPYLKLQKKSLFAKNKKEEVDFDWNTHNRLHEVLTELRVQNDCARTQIVQFHNGGEFLDGISMQKMSLTHESLASGTSSEMETKKDLLLSLCIEGLKLIKEDNSMVHVTELLEDTWCKKFLQSSNVITFSFLPIRIREQIMGYVMCQWCSWSKSDEVEEDSVKVFLEDARNIIEVTIEQQKSSNRKAQIKTGDIYKI
jgi:hypothetical protein